MSYQVLARKWRPKNFSQLIGQDSVRQVLSNALKQKRLYPVLIFTGPRGTGKTSTARILAKSLRCKNYKEVPCDQCEDCLLIGKSRHLDVIEIDGASNNGVEAIRTLKDTISYMPSTGYWKIYIIDEVHMLSQSAFNALLKTLEEPPPHVIFIMATTEQHKIPLTVLSRSQKLDFHLLSPLSIKNQLEMICKKENFSISDSILWLLAKQSRGSLRDAQSLLDQVITFCGNNKKEVIKILGLSDPQLIKDCLSALLKKKEQDIITLLSRLRKKGVESKLFLQNLIESVSHLLFLKQNPSNNPPLVQASSEEIEFMKQEIQNISSEELNFLFDMLLKGEKEMRFCQDSEMLLEVLLLRVCSAPKIEEITPLTFIKKSASYSIKNK
ncbi:MAG: DNA polymerase III subunit gamma/tau, partial [Bdellovibrionaceae bacterium]|nr:DNA polymerase III subunit gamma/tau [Pseudobdellovibrionaceae bacterium]